LPKNIPDGQLKDTRCLRSIENGKSRIQIQEDSVRDRHTECDFVFRCPAPLAAYYNIYHTNYKKSEINRVEIRNPNSTMRPHTLGIAASYQTIYGTQVEFSSQIAEKTNDRLIAYFKCGSGLEISGNKLFDTIRVDERPYVDAISTYRSRSQTNWGDSQCKVVKKMMEGVAVEIEFETRSPYKNNSECNVEFTCAKNVPNVATQIVIEKFDFDPFHEYTFQIDDMTNPEEIKTVVSMNQDRS